MYETYPVDKTCPNRHCGKHDSTKYSTCRWCGTPYHLTNLPASYDARQNSIWERMASNPVQSIFIGIFVLSIPASIFLSMELHSGGARLTTRRGSIPALPSALIYYFTKRTVENAHNTVSAENAKLANNQNDYDALVRRADAYWTTMDVKQAFDDYTAAIALKPDIPDTYEKRALIYDAMSAHDLADKDRNKANELRHK